MDHTKLPPLRDTLLLALKGMLIGATMLVPGLSGGTMALIIGIYGDLLHNVNQLLKRNLHAFLYLITVGIGGVLGLALFTIPMRYLLENYEWPMLWFFTGVILGGIPVLFRESGIKTFRLRYLIPIVLGVLSTLGLSQMNTLIPQGTDVFLPVLLPFGFLAAIALILPGISVSHVLLVFGLYQPLLDAINNHDIGFLFFLFIGVLVGILSLTGILERLMKRFPEWTYLAILGFVIGSLREIILGLPITISSQHEASGSFVGFIFPLIAGVLVMTLFTKIGNHTNSVR